MKITINEAKKSQSGKAMSIKGSDGGTYYTKDFSLAPGMEIEFNPNESEYQGNTMIWMKDIKVLAKSSPIAQGATAHLPMASNTINAAIMAGLIKTPADVDAWFNKIKNLIEGKPKNPFDELEDDVPF